MTKNRQATEDRDRTADRRKTAARVLPLIDLTSLGDDDQPDTIDALCTAAPTAHGPVAAVCIWPRFVAQAVEALSGTGIVVASVANFPEGDPDPTRALADSARIIDAGGTEVDVVYPWRTLAAGDREAGRRLVAATREAVGPDIVLKVILETGELDDSKLIRTAAGDSLGNGAQFLKTSTGKTARSATPEAARTLLEVLAEHARSGGMSAGIKVSGGVRTVDQAGEYLALADEIMGPDWADETTFRFGASSLLDDVLAALD